jgi:HlyD family secretion protein
MKKPSEYYLAALLTLITAFMASCSDEAPKADAYGNFEANTVLVSAEAQGILLFLNAREGEILQKDTLAALIDTSDAVTKRRQLLAQLKVLDANYANLELQIDVQDTQSDNIKREVERTGNLLADKAATQQQYDDLEGKLMVQELQTRALESQKQVLSAQRLVIAEQIAEVNNLIDKCRVINPVSGTVLETYSEAGELVSPGRPVYKIANLGEMELKFYVSGSQLSSIALGDSINVGIDTENGQMKIFPGMITWISSQVEFTPKIIQTREERVNMVYAVKLSVRNDGSLKIGMPGEVYLIANKE